jgi:hypothetical protein
LPGGSTRSDYIPGIGVGNVGALGALQSPGGNGAIMLTFTPTTASQSPPLSPTTAVPSARTSIPVKTHHLRSKGFQSGHFPSGTFFPQKEEEQKHKEEDVFLEDSKDVYQSESFRDTIRLPILSSAMIAAVGGFVIGIALMIMLYFCTRASKDHPHRAEYTPVLREVFFTTGSVKRKHKVVTRRTMRI